MESLSLKQAQKLVLHSQRLPPKKEPGSAVDATLSALEHLGYVQIDTISVIQRAHHHTLWNRNPRYHQEHLDQLQAQKKSFEYWSHAAAYLPMRDFRYSLPRKHAIATGEESHWHQKNQRLMKSVLHRIAKEGPLMAKDFADSGPRTGYWERKPAKRALDSLFMQGDLMAASRKHFHMVYDLPERVVSIEIDTSMPTPEEYARYLITRFLRANGLGQPAEMAYLLKNTKPLVVSTLKEMVIANEVTEVHIGEQCYYALPKSLKLLNRPLARKKLKILSPFDNLVIQRKRMEDLFGFQYLIECYVPKAKRKYGYFSLPILWDGQLVARMDCKADRKTSRLEIWHLALEPNIARSDELFLALENELRTFLVFNECTQFRLHKTTPAKVKSELRKAFSA